MACVGLFCIWRISLLVHGVASNWPRIYDSYYCLILHQFDPPEPASPTFGTMPDDAGRAMDVAHSRGFLAAAVADVSLLVFGASGFLPGCSVSWVLIRHGYLRWSLRHAEHLYVATPPA